VLARRVLLVDMHPMFRIGVRDLLEQCGRYEIVAEAASGHEAIRQALTHRPALVLLDVRLPGLTGLEVARVLKRKLPRAKLVVLADEDEDGRLLAATQAGIVAYLPKRIDGANLLVALGRVITGENLLHQDVLGRPELAQRIIGDLRNRTLGRARPSRRDLLPLSTREMEVLDCVAQGLSNKEIAQTLYLTEQTVKNHVTSVLRKLDVSDRVQAILFAAKNGWMEVAPPVPRSRPIERAGAIEHAEPISPAAADRRIPA
jgi:DNA-binding NarL/FixJ family response regulator